MSNNYTSEVSYLIPYQTNTKSQVDYEKLQHQTLEQNNIKSDNNGFLSLEKNPINEACMVNEQINSSHKQDSSSFLDFLSSYTKVICESKQISDNKAINAFNIDYSPLKAGSTSTLDLQDRTTSGSKNLIENATFQIPNYNSLISTSQLISNTSYPATTLTTTMQSISESPASYKSKKQDFIEAEKSNLSSSEFKFKYDPKDPDSISTADTTWQSYKSKPPIDYQESQIGKSLSKSGLVEINSINIPKTQSYEHPTFENSSQSKIPGFNSTNNLKINTEELDNNYGLVYINSPLQTQFSTIPSKQTYGNESKQSNLSCASITQCKTEPNNPSQQTLSSKNVPALKSNNSQVNLNPISITTNLVGSIKEFSSPVSVKYDTVVPLSPQIPNQADNSLNTEKSCSFSSRIAHQSAKSSRIPKKVNTPSSHSSKKSFNQLNNINSHKDLISPSSRLLTETNNDYAFNVKANNGPYSCTNPQKLTFSFQQSTEPQLTSKMSSSTGLYPYFISTTNANSVIEKPIDLDNIFNNRETEKKTTVASIETPKAIPLLDNEIPNTSISSGFSSFITQISSSLSKQTLNNNPASGEASSNPNMNYNFALGNVINPINYQENKFGCLPVIAKDDNIDVKANINSTESPISKYNQVWNELKSTHTKFEDKDFPANITSLGESDVFFNEDLIWCRPEVYYKGKYKLFDGNPSPKDIKHGLAGDCYFLCTLIALAEVPNRIHKLFLTKEPNEEGIYAIKLNDMGEWQEIIIDDQMPCWIDEKSLGFAKSNNLNNLLWVSLIEKAWAKLNCSYTNIEGSHAGEALHALTGAPIKSFFSLNDLSQSNKEKLWLELVDSLKNNFIIICTSHSAGIFYGHSYSLMSTYEVNYSGNIFQVLKFRNPNFYGEWTGTWSRKSNVWSKEIKKQCQWNEIDDGSFYLSWEDFFEYFEDCHIGRVFDNYLYNFLKVLSVNPNENVNFKLQVQKDGKYYLSVHQKSMRNHDQNEHLAASPVQLLLAKESKFDFDFVEKKKEIGSDIWIENYLAIGVYYIQIQIDWIDKQNHPMVLSVYGPSDASIQRITDSENLNFTNFCKKF